MTAPCQSFIHLTIVKKRNVRCPIWRWANFNFLHFIRPYFAGVGRSLSRVVGTTLASGPNPRWSPPSTGSWLGAEWETKCCCHGHNWLTRWVRELGSAGCPKTKADCLMDSISGASEWAEEFLTRFHQCHRQTRSVTEVSKTNFPSRLLCQLADNHRCDDHLMI